MGDEVEAALNAFAVTFADAPASGGGPLELNAGKPFVGHSGRRRDCPNNGVSGLDTLA